MKLTQLLEIWKNFIAESLEEEVIEEEVLDEEEEFQKAVKKEHPGMKKKLIGQGKEPNSVPYIKKPSYKRSKSAPAGFGGS
jgi:hypothetical protein